MVHCWMRCIFVDNYMSLPPVEVVKAQFRIYISIPRIVLQLHPHPPPYPSLPHPPSHKTSNLLNIKLRIIDPLLPPLNDFALLPPLNDFAHFKQEKLKFVINETNNKLMRTNSQKILCICNLTDWRIGLLLVDTVPSWLIYKIQEEQICLS